MRFPFSIYQKLSFQNPMSKKQDNVLFLTLSLLTHNFQVQDLYFLNYTKIILNWKNLTDLLGLKTEEPVPLCLDKLYLPLGDKAYGF